jgi:hypothetical protein
VFAAVSGYRHPVDSTKPTAWNSPSQFKTKATSIANMGEKKKVAAPSTTSLVVLFLKIGK